MKNKHQHTLKVDIKQPQSSQLVPAISTATTTVPTIIIPNLVSPNLDSRYGTECLLQAFSTFWRSVIKWHSTSVIIIPATPTATIGRSVRSTTASVIQIPTTTTTTPPIIPKKITKPQPQQSVQGKSCEIGKGYFFIVKIWKSVLFSYIYWYCGNYSRYQWYKYPPISIRYLN